MTEQTWRSLNLIFIAFVSSTLVYLFLGFLTGQSSQAPGSMTDRRQVLFMLSCALSVVQIFVVSARRRKAFSGTLNPGGIQELENQLRGRYIILFALSQAPAIYAIIYFFLTGHFAGQIFLTLLSWICLAISKPSRGAIEELERRLGF